MKFIIEFLLITVWLFKWIVIFHVVMSFIWKDNKVYNFLDDVVSPIYNKIKKFPHSVWMFDFSPIITLFLADMITYTMIIIKHKFWI